MMKKISLAALMLVSLSISAQDTFLNEQMTNTSGDVIGSARYVGMGGAMGALGADMGVISWNPAGIGLYRRSDAAITMGGNWNKSKIDTENRGSFTFDQAGVVFNFKTYNEKCPYFNFAFNYQKKLDFYRNFYADNRSLNGLSQMDQLAELASYGFGTDYNLAGAAVAYNMLNPVYIVDVNNNQTVQRYQNLYSGTYSRYTHHSEGALHSFELNFSTNINERAYVGATIGVDNMNYRAYTNYYEECENTAGNYGDYSVYDDYKITGYGINLKLGGIVRPIEDNPLRVGLAIETPTWYRFKSSQLYDITTYYDDANNPSTHRNKTDESYLEYTVRTPWKVRASLGSTIGNFMAWDVDYEFANYKAMSMGYPKYDDWDGEYSSYASTKDPVMNQQTKNTLKASHTLRAGMEFRPTSALSLRLGYNFITSAYKKNVSFDQWNLANDNNGAQAYSPAMDFSTNTSYMRMKPTNILTLGAGYQFKHFYVDVAYKVRNQKADFYAFDTSFTKSGLDFANDNPALADQTIEPTEVNLTRQSFVCTMGVKF